MRKRIKAIVRKPKKVTAEYAEEVFRDGAMLTCFKMVDGDGYLFSVYTFRHKGKVYFLVRCLFCGTKKDIIKECIEL